LGIALHCPGILTWPNDVSLSILAWELNPTVTPNKRAEQNN
jgi:hypothetical protein